ncbi:aminopeptidase [Neokomagataea thailandica NBRC 106555]|uniref:Aminopeptidase n=2 Tax=Neokomagataea TaxID=1223423 RepID=A0A4Y6VAJ9_9PROT|nr:MULTISPECIES: M1 family metallopeptidase [Neokomagataea]QDH25546.1 M1 family peptidase [Neokomagataea tanensis]GBR55597.1 aminopeptidase [Neokomagataea thailandica NBRC 106555]
MRRFLVLTTLLAGLPFSHTALAESTFSLGQTPGELPKTAVPSSYVIDLKTDLEKLTLKGKEQISFEVLTPTAEIVLNQAGLVLSRAVFDGSRGAEIFHDNKAETVTLRLKKPLPPGKHVVDIQYSGPILETPNGLYINDYHTPSGEKRRMLVSQFEVADARRMFPGWDEPVFKATYQLNVTLPANDVAVSNMPIKNTQSVSGTEKRVSFAVTPRMSTYLLALVAGDMGSLHGSADQTPIGVYAPNGLQEQGRFALNAAENILPYYNNYFGVKYPLPKMDMLAIPGNYQAGAMENWGALTYIDNVLLFDPKNSTPRTKELIYEVVAHEMAHQWSGDLVTMGWWNNIWLNEGFASWMEIKATDKMNPDWDIWPRQHETREATMSVDALSTTHPIQQTIHNVSEANSAFDSISYGKGELVIRMLEGWLGEDHFRDGMRMYMKAHAYNNATSQDLWNALSKASGQDVAGVARSFTEQPGIPLIKVASTCANGVQHYTLTQSRFAIHDPKAAPLTWSIPVVAGGPNLENKTFVLGSEPVQFDLPHCHSPFKLNLGESGYYRVQYDDSSWSGINTEIANFSAVDRANILGDQYALFRAGKAPLAAYLDLAQKLTQGNEHDIAVLEEIINVLSAIDTNEHGSPEQKAFRDFAITALQPSMQRLGWDAKPNESVLDTMLRPSVIGALGEFGDEKISAEARERFNKWKVDPSALAPNLVGVVTALAMKQANEADWSFMANKVRSTESTELKLRLFSAIASAHSPELIRKNVQLAYSGAIPNGRVAIALSIVAGASENPDLVWKLVKEYESAIRGHLAPWAQDGFLPSIAAHSTTPSTLEALQNDPSVQTSSGAKLATEKAINSVQARIEAMKLTQTQIRAWLKK